MLLATKAGPPIDACQRSAFISPSWDSSVSDHPMSMLTHSMILTLAPILDTGEHLSAKIREHYLESCMRQNIGFFDNLGAGEVTTRITADTNLIQDGLSEKLGLTLSALATFVAAFVIGIVEHYLPSRYRVKANEGQGL